MAGTKDSEKPAPAGRHMAPADSAGAALRDGGALPGAQAADESGTSGGARGTAPSGTHARRRRRGGSVVLPVIGICVGLLMLLAPILLDLREQWANESVISSMTDTAGTSEEQERWLAQAWAYNRRLAGEATEEDEALGILPYEEQLDGGDGGPVSWVEIPSIGVRLPVYLGTSDAVLSSGVGHVEGTSLPVGGPSTHCVLTGHSGLYDSRMFDDIRELEPGDLFAVHTMGETLTYEVTGSAVVLPDEVDSLAIRPGEDLCTLVTCTPYGVNDHRLLVYARRTDRQITQESGVSATRSVVRAVSGRRVWPLVVGIVIVVVGVVVAVLAGRGRKGQSRRR